MIERYRSVAAFCFFTMTLLLLAGCGPDESSSQFGQDHDGEEALESLVESVGEPYFGDLPALRQRGVLRALVVYSRTDFFLDQGRSRGIQHDFLVEFEKQLNAGIDKPEEKIRVHFLPVTFDQLLPALNSGLGDVVAAFLTVTDERQSEVDIIASPRLLVDEIVVSHPSAGELESLDDLSGRQVYVLRGSSYVEHLQALNRDFKKRDLQPVTILEGDPQLLSEDILELVNAGVVPISVVDNYRAELWAKVMPKLRLHENLTLTEGNQIGWAIRPKSPQLHAELSRFMKNKGKGSMLGNMLFNEYFANVEWIKDPDVKSDKLNQYLPLFRKYSEQYDLDPLALAAQAFQESGLNPKAKSHVGAVGLMQLLPSTAADKNVNIPDISSNENNVHAGAKYMAFLRDRYFSDADIAPVDRRALTLAAYNAGPARVRKMRSLSEDMGLNPNVWANNVEVAAARLVGRETVNYVDNIQKYYVSYQLSEKLQLEKEQVEP